MITDENSVYYFLSCIRRRDGFRRAMASLATEVGCCRCLPDFQMPQRCRGFISQHTWWSATGVCTSFGKSLLLIKRIKFLQSRKTCHKVYRHGTFNAYVFEMLCEIIHSFIYLIYFRWTALLPRPHGRTLLSKLSSAFESPGVILKCRFGRVGAQVLNILCKLPGQANTADQWMAPCHASGSDKEDR